MPGSVSGIGRPPRHRRRCVPDPGRDPDRPAPRPTRAATDACRPRSPSTRPVSTRAASPAPVDPRRVRDLDPDPFASNARPRTRANPGGPAGRPDGRIRASDGGFPAWARGGTVAGAPERQLLCV
jgi:hypothetical protein